MKCIYFVLICCLYITGFGQKNNYNSFISYNDEYLDKILSAERLSKADYLFYGTIKSVYIKQTDAAGKLSGTASTCFYDKNRNTIKRINYTANPQEYTTTTYYYNPKYAGNPVIHSTYQTKNREIIKLLTSDIDTIHHIIINNRFSNDKLEGTDSILYTHNYQPLQIKKYRNNALESIYKADYLENGKLYKSAYNRYNTSVMGAYYKYNSMDKQEYLYNISFDEFDRITPHYVDTSKTKEQEFIWLNKTDFQFYEQLNTVVTFNIKEKKLHRKERIAISTTYFNEQVLPIKVLSKNTKYSWNTETNYEYNNYNDVVTVRTKTETGPQTITTYQYIYDPKKNWTERKEYENGKLVFTTQREIVYE